MTLIRITVGPVNDAPEIHVPALQTAQEDEPWTIAGISVDDVDLSETTPAGTGAGVLRVMLSATRGTLDVDQSAASGVTVLGDQTSSVTLEGRLTDVQAILLAGVDYLGLPDLNGDDLVTVTADDLGNWPGPAAASSATFTVTVQAVNDPPVITAPARADTPEDTTLPLGGFGLADVDSATTPITVTLTVSNRSDGQQPNGFLTINNVPGGVTSSQVSGGGTSTVTIIAPVAQIAATLSDSNGWSYTPPGNFAGNAANPKTELLTITADDGGASGATSPDGTTDSRVVTLYVNEVNDPPAVTVPLVPGVLDEDTVFNVGSLGTIAVTDADAGNAVVSVQLSATRGTLTVNTSVANPPVVTGNGTGLIGLSGTLSQINTVLASFVNYQGTPNWNGTDVLTILANDLGNTGGPAASGLGRITLTVTAVNDAPQISLPGNLAVNEDTDLRLPSIQIADPDVTEGGADGVIEVTLSVVPLAPNVQAGTLTVNTAVVPLTITGANPGASLVVRGTLANINTMLAHPDGLKFRGAADGSGQVLFSVAANDLGKSPAPAKTTTGSLTITVRPVNDAPQITVPTGAQAATEDQPKLITGVSIADVDISETTSDPAGTGTGLMTVTLAAGRGTIDLSDALPAGVTVSSSVPTSAVTINGPLSGINALLASGITYQGLANANGSDTVTVTANDLGNWPAPARISTATVTVTVAKVNDAPVITAPGEQLLGEDPTQPYYIGGIAVADVDVSEGTGELKVDLRVSHGTLTLDLTVPGGLRGTNVTGNGTGSITIDKAGPGQVNATLSAVTGLRYVPAANYNGSDALTITADDKGNSGGIVPATTATVPISIAAVNDAPQLPWAIPPAVPPSLLVSEDTAAYIQWPANAVVDVDVNEAPGNGRLTVTLTAGHGTLTVSTGFGLTLADFTGNQNSGSTVEFTAPLSAINATLSAATGVRYLPNLNYNGQDAVRITVNDLGNTDAGLNDPKSVQGSVSVTVVAVNDPPVVTVPGTSMDVAEDTNLPLVVSVADVDAAEGTGELEMVLQVFYGTLTVNTGISGGVGAGNVTGSGTTSVSLIGTPQQLNATFAANGVVYRGSANFFTTAPDHETLLIRAKDEVRGIINTGPLKGEDSKTVTVNVHPVNDAPTIQIVAPNQIIEDTPAALPIIVNDAEMYLPIGANTVWTVRLDAALGTFTVLPDVSGGVPTAGISANGTEHVVLTGTGRQIQTTLAAANGVLFQGAKDFAGSDILTVTIDDPGPTTATTDDQTSSATLAYTIAGVNDAPQITIPAGLTTPEDVALALTGAPGVRVIDVDSGAANISVVLQVTNGKLAIGGAVPGGLNVAGSGTNKVTLVGPLALIGSLLDDPNGIKYTGNLNYSGTDTLSVTADDRGNSGTGGTKTAALSAPLVVTAVNDPPVVANPVADFSVDEDAPNTLIELFPGVFADPDNTSLTLTVSGNTNPSLVTATITGTRLTLAYQPNQHGSATIRVRASDDANSAEDVFVVTVRPMADTPVVASPVPDQVVPLGSATTVTVSLAGVFSDPDLPNDVLTLSSYNNNTDNSNKALVTGGSLSGQTLTLQLAAGAFGRADITVRVTDSTNRSASDTFSVIVNSLPIARDDAATTKEDVPVSIVVIANDSDPDGAIDPSTADLVAGSGPSHGHVVFENGTATYTPDANYSGTDSFQYTVQDNDGFESPPATVSITVQAVPDYQNPLLAADVNKSGKVTPIDALIAINFINGGGVLPADPIPPATPLYYYDVNGDGRCDAADVLAVVNVLNAGTVSGGEGESADQRVDSAASPTRPADGSNSAAVLLAIPDFTLLARAGDSFGRVAEKSSVGQASPQLRSAPIWPAAGRSNEDAWFEQIGEDASELLDVTLADALDEVADGFEAGFARELAADLVLSGLKVRA